jgi:hypothetical protein
MTKQAPPSKDWPDHPQPMKMGCDASSLARLSEGESISCAALLFLGAKGICERVEDEKADAQWAGATHWQCRLWTPLGRRSMRFSQGSAYVEPPTLLDCFSHLMDAAHLRREVDCPEESLHSGFARNLSEAKRHFNELQKDASRAEALMGSLASQTEAEDLFKTAQDLAQQKPALVLARAGKPFGLMEMAAWAQDPTALAGLVQTLAPSKAELEHLLSAATECDAGQVCAQMVEALLERQELAEALPKKPERTKGPQAL